MNEELLAKLCDNLQKNLQDQSQKVRYFVGVKPTNMFLAYMHTRTTASLPTDIPLGMFAEIWLGDTCVFRESTTNRSYRDWETDRKSTRLNSSHITRTRMPSSS